MTDSNLEHPIVIVGMGPGGLIAAIEALNKGHKVVIIENRDHFTRSQRVLLDKNSKLVLNHLLPRKKYQEIISDHDGQTTVRLDELQNSLYEILEKVNNKSNLTIYRGSQYEVSQIDLNTNKVVVKNKHAVDSTIEVNFSHLVGADGGRHTISDLVSKELLNQNKNGIEYNPLDHQTRQKAHGTIALKLNEGNLERKNRKMTFEDIPSLEKLGWKNPYLPKVYTLFDQSKKHIYLAGEIPDKILFEEDSVKKQEMLIQWGRLILQLKGYTNPPKDFVLDISESENEIDRQKNNLKATAFPVELKYTSTPSIDLPNGGSFAVIGDAAKNTNFHLGHGVNDAISDGLYLVRNINGHLFNHSTYQMHQKSNLSSLKRKMTWSESDDNKQLTQFQNSLDDFVIKGSNSLLEFSKKFNDKRIKSTANRLKKLLNIEPKDYDQIYLAAQELSGKISGFIDIETVSSQVKIFEKIEFNREEAARLHAKNFSISVPLLSCLSGILEYFNKRKIASLDNEHSQLVEVIKQLKENYEVFSELKSNNPMHMYMNYKKVSEKDVLDKNNHNAVKKNKRR